MEVQLKELIESIQKDGFEEAEKRSNAIIESAKKEAKSIISQAKKEAAEMTDKARKEAVQTEISSKATLEQAARDLLLALEQKIKEILQESLFTEVSKNLSGKILSNCIEAVVKSDLVEASSTSVELTQKDAKTVLDGLKKSLKSELESGMTLKPVSTMKGGFLVSQKDGKAYFDFSVEEISNAITKLVNPYLSAIIAEAAKKGE
mgnify:CR=1 FL=1